MHPLADIPKPKNERYNSFIVRRCKKRKGITMIFRLILLSGLTVLLVGCGSTPPGSVRVLGAVEYDRAFDVARSTLSQFSFSVMEADRDTGTILSRPTYVDNEKRVLGSTPTRKVARMKLTRDAGSVTVRLAIEVQQEITQTYAGDTSAIGLSNTYSGVPNDTPAQGYAAATSEQNTTWRRVRYDRQLELTILDEIAQAFNPAEAAEEENDTETRGRGDAER